MFKEGWNVVWSWKKKKIARNWSFPRRSFSLTDKEDDRSREKLARLHPKATLCVRPHLTAGKQGEEQLGGDGELQLPHPFPPLCPFLHLTQ